MSEIENLNKAEVNSLRPAQEAAQEMVQALIKGLIKADLLPENFSYAHKEPEEIPQPIDLSLRKKHADRFIKLGFNQELGISEEAYRVSLPEFLPQPAKNRGLFKIPLTVETRIPPLRQLEMAGFDTDEIEEYYDLVEVPKKPYSCWAGLRTAKTVYDRGDHSTCLYLDEKLGEKSYNWTDFGPLVGYIADHLTTGQIASPLLEVASARALFPYLFPSEMGIYTKGLVSLGSIFRNVKHPTFHRERFSKLIYPSSGPISVLVRDKQILLAGQKGSDART